MLNRALLILLILVSMECVAAPLVPTGSSATVVPVPNVSFGTTLLTDSVPHASQLFVASSGKAEPAPKSTPEAPVSTTSDHKTLEKAEPNEYMPLWSGRSVKITDFLLILFTAALAVFTFLLWLSTRALFKETQRSGKTAEISANAAEKSALAAETSSKVSRISVEAAIAAQQPRWLVKDMHVYSRSDYPRPTTSRRIVVTSVNHGTSAAEIIRKELRYVLVDAPSASNVSIYLDQARLMDAIKEEGDFGQITNEGAAFTFPQPTGFDDVTLTHLEAGTMQYYIVGSLQYRDYLDRTWEHSFVGLLDQRRLTLRNTDNTGQGTISPFIQPAAGPETDPYTYTRLVAPVVGVH